MNIKDAYYFSHDSNAKDDPKCVMMIEQLGMEGYGIYWVLVETLRDQPNFKYPLILLPALARRYNTTSEKMRTVVCNYGLFQTTEDEFFFSESLIRRMVTLEEKRDRQRAKAMKRWHGDDATALPQQSHGNAEVMPVKESKVKQSKEKKSITLNYLISDFSPEFQTAFTSFSEMRKSIKKPLTENAASLVLKKLEKIGTTEQERIEILNNSTMNCWQGVFELKDGAQKPQSSSPNYSDPSRYKDAESEDNPFG